MEPYMRNKERARRLEQEQRAREQKAFILQPKERLNPCTIPVPFALQTELREVCMMPLLWEFRDCFLVLKAKGVPGHLHHP